MTTTKTKRSLLNPAQLKRKRELGRKSAERFRKRHHARSLELARNSYYHHADERRAGVNRRIAKNRAAIDKLKEAPCLDCGRTYPPCVMEYDHVRGIKRCPVSRLLSRDQGLRCILAEIAKCELVCANCHRIRTWISDRPKPKSGRPRKHRSYEEE